MILSPRLGLHVWESTDKFDNGDLVFNWSVLDTEVGTKLYKDRADTITGSLTVKAGTTFNFEEITLTRYTLNVLKITGTVSVVMPQITDAAYASGTQAGIYRWRVNTDGKQSWAPASGVIDVNFYRDTVNDGTQLVADVSGRTYPLASDVLSRNQRGAGVVSANYVWNWDFEPNRDAANATTSGWSVASVGSIVAAATSITTKATTAGTAAASTGVQSAEIVTPATTNAGASIAIYRRFKSGVTYTIRAKVWAASATTNVQIGIGPSGGPIATSTATALTTTPFEHVTTWTPGVDTDVAYFFVRQTAATGSTFRIDSVAVYQGTGSFPNPTVTASSYPLAETMNRWTVDNDNIALSSSTAYLYGIRLIRGMQINQINLLAGTTLLAGISAAQAGLFTNSFLGVNSGWQISPVAITANMGDMLYQGPGAPIRFTLAATYTVPSTGLYHLGFVFVGTTAPSVVGKVNSVSNVNPLGDLNSNAAPLACSFGSVTSFSIGSNYQTTGTYITHYPVAWVN